MVRQAETQMMEKFERDRIRAGHLEGTEWSASDIDFTKAQLLRLLDTCDAAEARAEKAERERDEALEDVGRLRNLYDEEMSRRYENFDDQQHNHDRDGRRDTCPYCIKQGIAGPAHDDEHLARNAEMLTNVSTQNPDKAKPTVDWKAITPETVNPFDPRTHPNTYDDFETTRGLAMAKQKRHYDPDHDKEELCACTHTYYRHFDWAENYYPGCKYCECSAFRTAE